MSPPPKVTHVSDPASLRALVPQLCQLSAGTEMGSYKEAQWSFLVAGGGDVTAYTYPSSSSSNDEHTEEGGENSPELLGCVLKVHLSDTDQGYGMMLVSPKARGQGLARTLLSTAMDKSFGRNILAVCTEMGQPFYRKLGYRDVGTVSFLSASVKECLGMELTSYEKDVMRTTAIYFSNSKSKQEQQGIDPSIQQRVFHMDLQATGYDRSGRLGFMMSGQAGEQVGVGIVSTKSKDADKEIAGMAILRQDEAGGPYVLGPIVGTNVDIVLPLLQSLLRGADAPEDATVNLLISNHASLVERLVVDDNTISPSSAFSKSMELPAMAQDDGAIYEQKDGMEYFGLIHPTLG